VSANLTVWQVFVARSLVAIPIMIALTRAARVGQTSITELDRRSARSPDPRVDCLLRRASDAQSVRGSGCRYTNPIMIALLSAALIGEPVTGCRWGGFCKAFSA
jgi:hypothetical protein